MGIQGLRTSGVNAGDGTVNGFVAGQRPLNWREGLLLLDPNGMAPLTALTSQMKESPCDDSEFNWWEKGLSAQRVLLGAAFVTATTTVTVAAAGSTSSGAKAIPVGAVLMVEQTQELVRVASITSDTELVVVRGVAGTTATGITYDGSGVNPYLTVVGTAFEEGSSAPDGLNFDPVKRTNFLQIFRNNLGMTRTAMQTRLRTGDQVKEARRECLQYHGLQMEKAFFFGHKQETTLNSKPLRYTSGVYHWINDNASANVVTAETGMTIANLEEHLRKAFAFGSSEKVAFLGNRAMLLIQQMIRLGKNVSYNLEQGQKEYGMNVGRLTCPFGTLVLKTHPLFNQVTGGTNGGGAYYGLESWIFILDMANLKYRYLKGADTKYIADQQTPGLDGVLSGYLTECGLEIAHPTSHYVVKKMTTVAAES